MASISRGTLFAKLSEVSREALERAVDACVQRGNPHVEWVHWLEQILAVQRSDARLALGMFGVDEARLARDLTRTMDGLPRGASVNDLSLHIDSMMERAWTYASLMLGDTRIRSGHLLMCSLDAPELKNIGISISRELEKVDVQALVERFGDVMRASEETSARSNSAADRLELTSADALERFTVNLTERARAGELDPVIGRDDEIRQLIDVLIRRRQNNPLLTGEAGVGKSAVVEGLALRIASADVPPPLRNVSIHTLDVGLLQAGASMKGEFEARLRDVIKHVQSSEQPIILFIDEAHMLIGAGGSQGTGDAANLLKPELARGTLRTIAATTWSEYREYIEKDPALTRRFQLVKVAEPGEEQCVLMLRGLAGALEKHHGVDVLEEAIKAAVKLSRRYIPARQLPDKAVSLLDTACARVAMSQHAVPAEVEDSRHRISDLETELRIIGRERAVGADTTVRESAAHARLSAEQKRNADLTKRWEAENELIAKILLLRSELRKMASNPQNDRLLAQLSEQERALSALQGNVPLVLSSVGFEAVASVVSAWTGIPLSQFVNEGTADAAKLAKTLNARIVGQDQALEIIDRRLQTSRAGLQDPNKPIGVFLLVGPTGVGKTETALALTEALLGSQDALVTINMSEFQEQYTVSTLKGAPRGYVGYGEGGILTEAVRRRPYGVVLLDEVEKAHKDVHEVFFQVFDKGRLDDSEGRIVDFTNTLIILTSNVGSDLIAEMAKSGASRQLDTEAIVKSLRPVLLKTFPDALLGRLVVVPYYPLDDATVARIAQLQLLRIAGRLSERHGAALEFGDEVIDLLSRKARSGEGGGRAIDSVLTNTVLPAISRELLVRMSSTASIRRIAIGVENGEFVYTFA
jgi:type VI secretion system protein VasG